MKSNRLPAAPASPDAPHIMFLTRQLDIGGAQRQLVELALGLHGIGWKVTVVTFYGGGALAGRLEEAGVELVSIDKVGRWDLVGFAVRLIRLVRQKKPQILHGYLETSNVVLALLRYFFGRVRVVWGVRASNMDLTHYDRLAAIESRIGIVLSRFADLIICNSGAGKSYCEAQGYPRNRMVVIPNGVDVMRFAPDHEARVALRAEWGIGPEETLVGIVARLDPMKDHRNFVRAAAQVVALRARVRFVCIGDGPDAYLTALRDEARTLRIAEGIIWAGSRDDMGRVYNALDIAVSSSSFGEGFPNTIVEAMATGVPCVVTDVGDSAAIVGEFGWVCPPGDSAALARALLAAIASLPCDTSRIRDYACKTFNSTMLLERTIAQLNPLVAGLPVLAGTLDWRHK